MIEARRATRSEELIFERERQGVRTLTLVRGLFVLIVTATVWVIGASLFEKMATTAIAAFVFVAIWFSLFLLAGRTAVEKVGLAGCMIDIAFLGTLPIIWYLSVGGSDVPPAYMLKTQITVATLGIVALNALAIRPLYPLVVAAGGIYVHDLAGITTRCGVRRYVPAVNVFQSRAQEITSGNLRLEVGNGCARAR